MAKEQPEGEGILNLPLHQGRHIFAQVIRRDGPNDHDGIAGQVKRESLGEDILRALYPECREVFKK